MIARSTLTTTPSIAPISWVTIATARSLTELLMAKQLNVILYDGDHRKLLRVSPGGTGWPLVPGARSLLPSRRTELSGYQSSDKELNGRLRLAQLLREAQCVEFSPFLGDFAI